MRRSSDRLALFLMMGLAVAAIFGAAYMISRSTLSVSTQRLRDAQVAACQRGNVLRAESNRRMEAHQVDAADLLELARGALAAREEAYRQSHSPIDLKAAKVYETVIRRQQQLRFGRVALVDCERVIPQP